MNILFCYDKPFVPEYGGVARVSCVLADAFQDHNAKCFFFSLEENKKDATHFSFPNGHMSFLEKVNHIVELINHLNITTVINQSGSDGEHGGLMLLMKDVKCRCNIRLISVIHSSMFETYQYSSVIYRPIFEKYKIGFMSKVLAVPGIPQLITYYAKLRSRTYYNDLYESSDYVVVLGNSYKKEYESLMHRQLEKVIFIPNPVTIKEVQSTKSNVILYVGRVVNTHKQVNKLIEIWSAIASKTNWELHIVGDGPDKKILENYVNKKQIPRVTFLGQQNPEYEYSIAKIICLTSSFEGLPLVLLEGMTNRCVPITFGSYGSAYDIINDGESGFIIEPFKIKKYATSLLKVINNEELRAAMSNKAYTKAQSYTIDNIVDQWLCILK